MLLREETGARRCFSALAGRAAGYALALVVSSAALTTSRAQDQPVVFVHGLFSSGGVWQQTATVLQDEFAIQPVLPSLGWQNSFFTQANGLHGAIGNTSGIAAVGHSNGGLVLREYLRGFGGSSRINRGLTVGTPHGGAALAAHALNGNLVLYSDLLFNSIADPINFYYGTDPEFQEAFDVGPLRLFRILAQFMAGVARSLNIIINAVGVPIPGITNTDVLPQMPPGSGFISSLNAASSISGEAAVTQSRVGLATSISPQNAFFRNFSNDPQGWGAVRHGLLSFALLMYDHYSAHPDFLLRANADRWLLMFFVLADLDVVWHGFIGSLAGFQLVEDELGQRFVIVEVDHQDGLVPRASATWPGASDQRNLLFPQVDIAHREQRNHPEVREVIRSVFLVDFGVPLRAPPPPPPGDDDDCIPEPPAIACG